MFYVIKNTYFKVKLICRYKIYLFIHIRSGSSVVEQLAVNQLVGSSNLLRSANIWPVGEAVNTHGFHPCIHGFESRTGHHLLGR